MNYHNIERLVNYGVDYRRQELADLLEEEVAYDLADDICAIMITMKSTMPAPIWSKMIDNLLRFQANNQFEMLVEEDEDNSTNPTGE